MSARHISRAIVLQTLFELDSQEWDTTYINSYLDSNASEMGTGDKQYTKKLIDVLLAKKPEIDEVIIKSAPDWPLDKIAIIDRNILRIGISELVFDESLGVPPKVAINEAVELAKEYGAENSAKFVNGVLGAIYNDMGQPRKDEGTQHKATVVKNESLAGAVVYAYEEGDIYLALVHDIFGRWTLSKGKIEEGESAEVCVVREMKEEMGLDVTVKDSLGENEYIANDPGSGQTSKHVQYFLVEAPFTDIVLGKSSGLDDARWFKLQDVINLNIYEDILPIVTSAITKLAVLK